MIFHKDSKIYFYKNLHKGETCCIFATGPSINKVNFQKLNSFCTFGCNSFYNHHFKTNYFCVTDELVWNAHKKEVLKLKVPIFKGSLMQKDAVEKENIINLKLKNKFLVDCKEDYGNLNKGIYRGHTVVNHILQITYWMGFKKVFLFGCDCDYSGSHHFDGTPIDNFHRTNWKEVFDQYEVSKYFYEKDDRKIYNATIGGRLEVFQRKSPCVLDY